MTFYPLIEIILYIALLFAPPDATHVTISGPDYSIELARTGAAWTAGDIRLVASDGRLVRTENGRGESHPMTEHVAAALDHDWHAVSKITLHDATTLEKTASGFVLRVNDGDPAVRAYTIAYHRPAPPPPPPRARTINVLGAGHKPRG